MFEEDILILHPDPEEIAAMFDPAASPPAEIKKVRQRPIIIRERRQPMKMPIEPTVVVDKPKVDEIFLILKDLSLVPLSSPPPSPPMVKKRKAERGPVKPLKEIFSLFKDFPGVPLSPLPPSPPSMPGSGPQQPSSLSGPPPQLPGSSLQRPPPQRGPSLQRPPSLPGPSLQRPPPQPSSGPQRPPSLLGPDLPPPPSPYSSFSQPSSLPGSSTSLLASGLPPPCTRRRVLYTLFPNISSTPLVRPHERCVVMAASEAGYTLAMSADTYFYVSECTGADILKLSVLLTLHWGADAVYVLDKLAESRLKQVGGQFGLDAQVLKDLMEGDKGERLSCAACSDTRCHVWRVVRGMAKLLGFSLRGVRNVLAHEREERRETPMW